MKPISNRRSFLQTAALGAGVFLGSPGRVAAATDPYVRPGGSRLRLSLAAYSFLKYFPAVRGKPNAKVPEEMAMDFPKFIRLCAENGCDAELTSYVFDDDVPDRELADCRLLGHQMAVEVSGTSIGNNFTFAKGTPERDEQMAYTKQWIDRAMVMGAPHIRVFAGVQPKGMSLDEAERNVCEALEEAADYGASRGVMLGVENHDELSSTAERLLRVVKAVKSPWLGVNLDTANFRVDDPYPEIEACVPYALNVQVKAFMRHGGRRETDFAKFGKILRDGGYRGYVVLEYEEKEDPYVEVPKLLNRLREL
ncbi:xylose isomerase [Haloferula helveola]|uniref:Xylose isomerase n=1 Tax=Haloferula helveola TaxID=490095 RepID=A0ABM7REI3_9BACT|nr:xylose isomerase [Haloferula helveola]